MQPIKLTPELAEAYFNTLRDTQVAGYTCYGDVCPLTKALLHAGAMQAEVHYESYTVNGIRHITPSWAAVFAKKVDGYPIDGSSKRRVTAKQARRILQEVRSHTTE